MTSLFEERTAGIYHNSAVVFDSDGTLAGKYRKMHIPDDPGFYEKFYFTEGDLGFKPIETSIGKLGVLICWDQWFPEASRAMGLNWGQIIIYIPLRAIWGWFDWAMGKEGERRENRLGIRLGITNFKKGLHWQLRQNWGPWLWLLNPFVD